MSKIILIGMPGAGKSTITNALQDALDDPKTMVNYTRMDQVIKGICGDVSNITEYYRNRIQHDTLSIIENICSSREFIGEEFVIDTGGGIVMSEDCRQLLRTMRDTFIVWVKCDLKYVRDPRTMSIDINSKRKLADIRYPFYHSLCNYAVINNRAPSKTPEKLAKDIYDNYMEWKRDPATYFYKDKRR